MARLQEGSLTTVQASRVSSSSRLRELSFLRSRKVAIITKGLSVEDIEAISSTQVHVWIEQLDSQQLNIIALSSAKQGKTMTYRELANRSSQAVHYLATNGVALGDGFLLHFARNLNTVVKLLGIVGVDVCYVMFPKKLSGKRKAAIAATSKARFSVTDEFTIHQVSSPSGYFHPLYAAADGSVTADAVAPIVVKTLGAPRRDNDAMYAVFERCATGSDSAVGKLGFTVSSSAGQARAVAAAIGEAVVVPELFRYVELHGSSMEDAFEVSGLELKLEKVQQSGVRAGSVVHVDSNKGIFGNTEAASGMLT